MEIKANTCKNKDKVQEFNALALINVPPPLTILIKAAIKAIAKSKKHKPLNHFL
jgi:hypothetical protein